MFNLLHRVHLQLSLLLVVVETTRSYLHSLQQVVDYLRPNQVVNLRKEILDLVLFQYCLRNLLINQRFQQNNLLLL